MSALPAGRATQHLPPGAVDDETPTLRRARLHEYHLRLTALLLGGVVVLFIGGALLFTRAQTETYRSRLSQIDATYTAPLTDLDAAQQAYRDTQATVDRATRATSPQDAAAQLSKALTTAQGAQVGWKRFKERPAIFEGEPESRASVDAAITANDDAGQQLGVAVLDPTPDAATVARLATRQRETADQMQAAFAHIEDDLYLPALRRNLFDLEADAGRSSEAISALALIVVSAGALIALLVYRRTARVERQAHRDRDRRDEAASERALEAELQHALDMADSEDRVFSVIDRALHRGPTASPDVLLAASDTSAFTHVIPLPEKPGASCPVLLPSECPVARHGHELVTTNSTALDACPYLLDRDSVPGAAICEPVSITGHTIGVLHEAYERPNAVDEHRVRELEIVARKTGERIATLRAFARVETQAHTDPLTGLLNRRSLDDAVDRLTAQHTDFAVAYADLDHFKLLNDTYGHEAGDTALRQFSNVLRSNVRPDDIVARYGGEEFVVVLPGCTPEAALPVLQRVQGALAVGIGRDGGPTFTVSIGIASAHQGGTFDEVLARADGSLRQAKDGGRNQIIVTGEDVTWAQAVPQPAVLNAAAPGPATADLAR